MIGDVDVDTVAPPSATGEVPPPLLVRLSSNPLSIFLTLFCQTHR
jgi:hypothetical protein